MPPLTRTAAYNQKDFKMKTTNILLSAALILSLASCDDKSDLGIMQENPQLAIMSANGITVEFGEDLKGDALNLPDYENKDIDVIKLVEAKDLPEDASIAYEMQVSPSEDFSTYSTLKVTDGKVKANDWDNAFISMLGKAPTTRENWVRFAVYANSDSEHIRMGGADFYYAAKKLNVTPYDLKLPVEHLYYLCLTENGNSTYTALTHSTRHQYDDPTFSLLFEVTPEQVAAGLEWCIVPESAYSSHSTHFGVSETGEPTDAEGNLMQDGANGKVNMAGKIKIEVNMLDLTYKFSYAFDYMYTPGPANGWGFENNMLLYTNDYINYQGFVYVQQEFKLTGQAGWSPLNWGTPDGTSLTQDGPNITVDQDGLYWVTARLDELTFTKTLISAIGMIGGFNGWGGDVELAPSQDFRTWTGTVTVEEPTEWKFRMNNAWDINLGGSVTDLQPNGDNLSFDAAGTYQVTLNLGTLPYSCTIEKK